MDTLVIEGNARLQGEVAVSGSKNTALPLLFSSILFQGEVHFENVPRLWDVETTLKILELMGCETRWDKEAGKVSILPTVRDRTAPYEWVRRMRAGILALGPLIARYGEARVSLPGGCSIGARPVNLHIEALEKMGVQVAVEDGYIHAKVKERLRGARIVFPQVTVTGTENILFVAACAEGMTTIENAASEPEVIAVGEMLRDAGADITGLGTSVVRVHGGKLGRPKSPIVVPPDRIETGTWVALSAATRNPLTIKNCRASEQTTILDTFRKIGVGIVVSPDGTTLHVTPADRYTPIDLQTQPFPGFATDMQAQLLTCLCLASGTSRVRETIFENRFMHVAELRRLGAEISLRGNLATVRGPVSFHGAPIMATDLRASACLVIAGLAATGTTRISRIYHLDRGYQRLDEKLNQLGARITRVKEG